MGKGAEEWRAKAQRRQHAQEEDDVGCCSQEDRSRSKGEMGEGEGGLEKIGVGSSRLAMGKFSLTKQRVECEQIARTSTAYGRRRRNWIDAHGSVPVGQVVDASCGHKVLFPQCTRDDFD